jgi:hypothetical protein
MLQAPTSTESGPLLPAAPTLVSKKKIKKNKTQNRGNNAAGSNLNREWATTPRSPDAGIKKKKTQNRGTNAAGSNLNREWATTHI